MVWTSRTYVHFSEKNRLRESSLHARRLHARRPYVGPPLIQARQLRHKRFPMRQQRRVLFMDVSRFALFRSDSRRHVYRHRGERFADACVDERDRFEGASVVVQGGILHGVKS